MRKDFNFVSIDTGGAQRITPQRRGMADGLMTAHIAGSDTPVTHDTISMMLTCDLPGRPECTVEEIYKGRLEANLSIESDVRKLFTASDIRILHASRSIWIDEVKATPGYLTHDRFIGERAGLGTIFLRNVTTLAQRLDYDKISLLAGRRDGALFWSLNGFGFSSPADIKKSNFTAIVENNMARLRREDLIDKTTAQDIDRLIIRPDLMVNCAIAGMRQPLRGSVADESAAGENFVGAQLMQDIPEFAATLDLRAARSGAYIVRTAHRAALRAQHHAPRPQALKI